MGERGALWEVGTVARQLTQALVRQVPVTVASVSLWDQPGSSLTVGAVSTTRPLAWPRAVGTPVPLADAPWHRAVFERREPVYLEQDSPTATMSAAELDLTLVRDVRSVYLMPILVDGEIVGIVTLGEMRSRAREPFTEEKRRRCAAVVDDLLASSAHAWIAGRLRRQVRAMSLIVQTVKEMLDVRSYDDLVACLASKVASWLGSPVGGLLVRPCAGGSMEILGRWQMPEPVAEADAAQLLLAIARAEHSRQGPVSVTRVADDPLDPLHAAALDGHAWARVCLPLLEGDQLLGVACLYVEGDLYPTTWELEGFRWLGEIASAWMMTLTVLRQQESERGWLRLAARELLTSHQRAVLREALTGVMRLVASRLPDRVERAVGDLSPAPTDPVSGRQLAEVATREAGEVLAELLVAVGEPGRATVRRIPVNELTRWAVEIARVRDAGAAPVQLDFEPSPEPIVVETSLALLGALTHAIQDAVDAVPEGGRVQVRTQRDDGHVVISVTDSGPGPVAGPRQEAFEPAFAARDGLPLGLGVSVARGLIGRHGGEVRLAPAEAGGRIVTLRLPAAASA